MNFTKRLFSVEQQHFNRLSREAQQLILTYFLLYLILPIFGTFTNAFIWRQSQDISTVTLYNLALLSTIPLGFYINGQLLKKFLPSRLYFIGLLSQVIITVMLIFSPVINHVSIFLFGILTGTTAGLLWANKNLLTLRITLSENRIYFSSLETTIWMLANIVIPLLIGVFIVFGQTASLYTPIQAYYMLALFTFIMAFFIFRRIRHVHTKLPQLNDIVLKKPSKTWKKMRVFTLIFGMFNGLSIFIPTIMVLSFVGKEDALGIVQSLSAVVGAIVIYSIGKKVTREQRQWIIAGGILFSLLASFSFGILYSMIGVFTFFALQSLGHPLSVIGQNTLYFDLVERENERNDNHYSHIFDSEVFLSIGRIIGICIFLLAITFISESQALRYTMILFAFIQLALFIIVQSIEKGHKKIAVDSSPETII